MSEQSETAPPAVNQEGAAEAQAVTDQRIQNEAIDFLSRFKFFFAVLVLFLIKFIFDNLIPCTLILCTTYSLLKIRNGLDMQLSLKNKSSCITVFNLLMMSIFLLFTTAQFAYVFKFPYNLMDRLLFLFDFNNHSKQMSFMNTIWSCVIVDGVVHTGFTALKLIVCLLLGSNPMKCGQWKNIFSVDNLRNLTNPIETHPSTNNRGFISFSSTVNLDLEGGSRPHTAPATPVVTTIYDQLAGSVSDRLFGLARRPSTSGSGMFHPQVVPISSPYTQSNGASSSSAIRAATNEDDDSDINSSQEAAEYLKRLRACTLIDMIGLVYRTALPLPAWYLYFRATGLGAHVLPYLYLGMKFSDLAWKSRGLTEAIYHFCNNSLEFGHHSTSEEYNSTTCSYDCPVCFDAPSTPVTLDCKHIFCEMCISEWLDKEKTCPVCRAEVKCVSPLVSAMKKECASIAPIVT